MGIKKVPTVADENRMQTETDLFARASVKPAVPQAVAHPFTFSGTGWQYFKIWLPNIALTILTCGLYGPWAKVRREQFFHSHTHLAGSSFEYTANPRRILRGRLLLFGFALVFGFAGQLFPPFQVLLTLVMFPVAPWLVVQALRFRARYTSYRNIAFNFSGTYGEAVQKFILFHLLGIATLGALFPWVKHEQRCFMVTRLGFGRSRFQFRSALGRFYLIYGGAIAFVMLAVLAALPVAAVVATLAHGVDAKDAADPASLKAGALVVIAALVLSAWFVFPLVRLKLACATWSNASLGEYKVRYEVGILPCLWVGLSNMVLSLLTLGLAFPYCKVRMHRFKIARLSVIGPPAIDGFVGARQEEVKAFGDEASEFVDIGGDLGL